MPSTRQRYFTGICLVVVLLLGGVMLLRLRRSHVRPPLLSPAIKQDIVSPLATWPWPRAIQEKLPGGVTHWEDTSSPDGTRLDLFDFDFQQNPYLRLEIFDQDQDDAKPFDDKALFWERGVGQIVQQQNTVLEQQRTGQILAAWNGLFFSPNRYGAGAIGEHVSPVVLAGIPHYTAANYRWTFGVKINRGYTVFKTLYRPDKKTLAREFDWAAGGAQCLISEGRPLDLQPFPTPGTPRLRSRIPTTPHQAGYIPVVDHIKTSRVSLGWSKDSRHLYLLFVQDPDTEASSAIQFRHGLSMQGGWMLAELQRFWQAKNVWGAINSDGGDLAQMTYLRKDGNYLLVPPMISGSNARRIISPKFENAPSGGTLMTLYIRDASLP